MTYEKRFHPKIKNDLKKIDRQLIQEIKDVHIDNIIKNPYSYPTLKGKLSKFRSYHFRKNRVEYRIIYEIMDNSMIVFMMIAKRENIYDNVLKRVSK